MSTIAERANQISYVGRFILLLLGAKDSEPIPGPIHLQKEMYLLQRAIPKLADKTDYKPCLLGPNSEIVPDEMAELVLSGMVGARQGGIGLTADGEKAFDMMKRLSDEKEVQMIEECKDLLNDLTQDELLAFVYFSYPSQDELEKTSAKYRNLLPKRQNLAMSMYQKDKISVQKAAHIAGECLEDFLERLGHGTGENL